MKYAIVTLFAACLMLASCSKETTPDKEEGVKSRLTVEFDHIVGGEDLHLNTGNYSNASHESFQITKLKYYVSNFIFTNDNGDVYTVPQDSCYFLIDESVPASCHLNFDLPEGTYSKLSFILGVDSLRNTMPIDQRTGALDPTGLGADMYWDWNSGYIFFKMDGTSPSSLENNQLFQFHIGGFGGYETPTINNIKTVTIDLSNRGMPEVKSGWSPNIHLMVDILKVFDGVHTLKLANNASIMFGNLSKNVADNYATMFQHDHTEN